MSGPSISSVNHKQSISVSFLSHYVRCVDVCLNLKKGLSLEVYISSFALFKMASNSDSDSDTPVTPKKAKLIKPKQQQKYKPEWENQYEDSQNKYLQNVLSVV